MQLDHLVYAGPNLDVAAARIADVLGVRAAAGGRHLGRGTHNRLVGLGAGAYLEVIGPDPEQPDPAQPRPFGIDELDAPCLVAWAVRSGAIDGAVAQARLRGLDLGPVTSMQRSLPDGQLLRWRLTPPYAGLVPFVIDWGSTPHPAASLGPGPRFRSLRIEATDADSVRHDVAALGVEVEVLAAPADRLVAVIEAGGAVIELV